MEWKYCQRAKESSRARFNWFNYCEAISFLHREGIVFNVKRVTHHLLLLEERIWHASDAGDVPLVFTFTSKTPEPVLSMHRKLKYQTNNLSWNKNTLRLNLFLTLTRSLRNCFIFKTRSTSIIMKHKIRLIVTLRIVFYFKWGTKILFIKIEMCFLNHFLCTNNLLTQFVEIWFGWKTMF